MQLPKGIEEVDKALESFRQRDYNQCLALLQAAAKKHSELLPPRLILAKLFLMENQTANGRTNLEQAAIENPNHPEVYLAFAKLALQEGRITEAALDFDKALALAKSNKQTEAQSQHLLTDIYAGLATVSERRKDWATAASALESWLALDPKNGQVRQRHAQARFRLGKRDKIHEELEQAGKDQSGLEPAATMMGWLYTEAGKPDKGREWMEYAIKETPKDAKVHLSYARWLLDQHQPEEAKARVETAAQLDPDSSEGKMVRGLIAWHLRDYKAAEGLFQAVHLDSPANVAASNYLALSLAEQSGGDKRRRALELAEINARLYPNSTEALATVGWIYFRLGRMADADRTLRAAITQGNISSDAAYFFAKVQYEAGRTEEAKKVLKLALNAKGLFAFRKEAQELLDRLDRKTP
jgi:tetratricopeptide (TPR) repeat protein